jgi:hypothetical protein
LDRIIGSLQGAYLILAARALRPKVDETFFAGGTWKSDFLLQSRLQGCGKALPAGGCA